MVIIYMKQYVTMIALWSALLALSPNIKAENTYFTTYATHTVPPEKKVAVSHAYEIKKQPSNTPFIQETVHEHGVSMSCATKNRHMHSNPDKELRYNLNSMSTERLIWYFYALRYTEEDILSHPFLYLRSAYLAIAKHLPRYPEFVEKYCKQYGAYSRLFKIWETMHFRYCKGLAKQFAQLYQECEAQRRTKKIQERKAREIHSQKEQACAAYCTQLDSCLRDECILDAVPHHHKTARNSAYAQIKTAAVDRITQKHSVPPDITIFAQSYDISEQHLTIIHGNLYEQQLHTEFLEQLNEACAIFTNYALQPSNLLIDVIGHSIAIGMEANRLQQPNVATIWANCSWKLLEIVEGIGDGLLLFAETSIDMILHPIQTFQKVGHLFGTIAGTCAHALGTALRWHEMIETGNCLMAIHEIDQVVDGIITFGSLCTEKLSTMSTHDIAKHVTTITADILLTHTIVRVCNTLCNRLEKTAAQIAELLNCEDPVLEFATLSTSNLSEAQKVSMLTEETIQKTSGLGIFNAEITNSIEHVTAAINDIVPNRVHHILTTTTGKHAWSRIIEGEVTWSKVKDAITKVMLEGTTSAHKSVFKKSLIIKNEIVDVIFAPRPNNTISIVDAWVRTQI